MIRLLQWLIFGHVHHWKVIETREVKRVRDQSITGDLYVLQCTECGTVRGKQVGL